MRQVPPADDCPDAVFVEDTVVVYGDLAVVTRPGRSSAGRRPPAPRRVRELGYRVARIEGPGTLDGGDVLKHRRHRLGRARRAHQRCRASTS